MINLDNIVLESEYNVTIQLIEEHFKQLMLIDNYEVYQEGVGDEYLDYRGKDKDGNKENIFMSIIKFIGRLINNIIYKIKQSIKKKKQIQGGSALLNEYCKKHETDIAKTIHPNGDSNLEIKIKCHDKNVIVVHVERTLSELMPELHHNHYLVSTIKLCQNGQKISSFIATDTGDFLLKQAAEVVDKLNDKAMELTKGIDSASEIIKIEEYFDNYRKSMAFMFDNIHLGDRTDPMSYIKDFYMNNQKYIDKIERGLDELKRTFTQKLIADMLNVEKHGFKKSMRYHDQTQINRTLGNIIKIYLNNIKALDAIVLHLSDINTAIDVINKELGTAIKGSNKAKVENVTPEQSENNTNITNGFKNAVQKRDLHAIRITLKNSAYSDPSKEYYNANVAYLKEKDPELYNNLYETHDGEKFNEDKSSWDKKYLNQILVDLSDNFSRQRVDHLFEVAQYIKSI